MLGMRGDGVEHPVRADALRLVDVELNRPRRRLPGDQRLDLEIFGREDFEVVKRAEPPCR